MKTTLSTNQFSLTAMPVFGRMCALLISLFAIIVNTACATEGDHELSKACGDKAAFLSSLSAFLENQIRPITLSTPEDVVNHIDKEIISGAEQQKECALALSNKRLLSGEYKTDEECGVFKMSVTLGGLHSKLTELSKCASDSCTTDNIQIDLDVVRLQFDRLNMLLVNCEAK